MKAKTLVILTAIAIGLVLCSCSQVQELPVRPTMGEEIDLSKANIGFAVGPLYAGAGVIKPEPVEEVLEPVK